MTTFSAFFDDTSITVSAMSDQNAARNSGASARIGGKTPLRLPGGRSRVVRHGHVSADVADTIWVEALEAWGVQGSSQELREEIILGIAEAAIQGTSVAADLEAVTVTVDEYTLSFGVLADVSQRYTRQPNPVRVFLRSFRNAVIPVTIYRLLSHPENAQLRALAAWKYGCEPGKTQYAYDMIGDAAPFLDMVGYDLLTARSVNRSFLKDHQSENSVRGMPSAAQDIASRQTGGMSAQTSVAGGGGGGAAIADQGARLGFTPLR